MHKLQLYHLNIYTLILSIHLAIIVYTASTFLSGIFGQEYIWIIYSLAAFLALSLNFSITSLLKNFDIVKINNSALIFAFINLLLLAFTNHPFYIFTAFIIFIILSDFMTMLASIMTEDLSKDTVTGGIRGRFISMQSLAYVVSPFFTAIIIKYFGISSIFLFSSIFILAALIYFRLNIKSLPKISIHDKKFSFTLKRIWKNPDIRTSIITLISVNTFFIAAVVFIPFKMSSMGIPLTTYLSVLLPIALIPFLFIPSIIGHIEDKMRDEKQFILFGIFGLLLILLAFALVNSSSLIIWAIILFISRVFASITETSINSYFFKKINKSDTAIISIFSSSAQIAYLIFSPILSLVFIYGNLQTVFLSISFFLSFVLILVSKIHNTDNYEKHKNWKEIWRRSQARTRT